MIFTLNKNTYNFKLFIVVLNSKQNRIPGGFLLYFQDPFALVLKDDMKQVPEENI